MKISLLGSGDAIGMPVPMCECEYCQESEKRRRTSLFVFSKKNTHVCVLYLQMDRKMVEEEGWEEGAVLLAEPKPDLLAAKCSFYRIESS